MMSIAPEYANLQTEDGIEEVDPEDVEVGSIIVKADVGIDMKRLFLIFLERTVLALPLLVLAAHFILE